MDDPEPVAILRVSKYRRRRHLGAILIGVAAFLVLAAGLALSHFLPNDQPDDAKVYSRIATNVIDAGVFSHAEKPPLEPSLIRLPGYPLFLSAIYSIAGKGNDGVVRLVQAVLLFLSAVFAGLTAARWKQGSRRKRRKAGLIAFFLAALCPFTAIYSTVLLTEAVVIFLLAVMVYTATRAIVSPTLKSSVFLWLVSAISVGVAVEMRPDSGLFAVGLGITLLLSDLVRRRGVGPALLKAAVFGIVFLLVLTPWAIRNYQNFGIFQPLAPAHGEMPGEFVPHGYYRWLRTWIDDSRYIGPMLWSLEERRIDINSVPEYAFANEDERLRVTTLLNQYNDSDPDHPLQPQSGSAPDDADDGDDDSAGSADTDEVTTGQPEELDLKISPEVDSGFAKLADERIEREPLRFYVLLPAKRAASMWFDTHSDYYPFGGEIFPVKDLDNEKYQNVLLPLFAAIVWFYTILTAAGASFLMRSKKSRIWVWFVLLMSIPRIAFFGTLENPEPRYLVELFVFAAILSGVALSNLRVLCGRGVAGIVLNYKARG